MDVLEKEVLGQKRRVKNVLGMNGCPECQRHLGGNIKFCPTCLENDYREAVQYNSYLNGQKTVEEVKSEEISAVKQDIKNFLFETLGWTKIMTLVVFFVSIVWSARLFPTNMSVGYFGHEISYGWATAIGILLYLILFSILTYRDARCERREWLGDRVSSWVAGLAIIIFLALVQLFGGLRVLSAQLEQAKNYHPAINIPLSTKTWTSANDWGEWGGGNLIPSTQQEGLLLSSGLTDTTGSVVVSPGSAVVIKLPLITVNSQGVRPTDSWSLSPDFLCGYNCFTPNGESAVKKLNSGQYSEWRGYRVGWKAINNVYSDDRKSINTIDSGRYIRAKVYVPIGATLGPRNLYVSSINQRGMNDEYGGPNLLVVGDYSKSGTATITYDAQSDGSAKSGYHWNSLMKQDTVKPGQSIQYFVQGSSNKGKSKVPSANQANKEQSWIGLGWHKITWSGNTADLSHIKGIQGKRYLSIAIAMSTSDVTKTPVVNSLTVNYN